MKSGADMGNLAFGLSIGALPAVYAVYGSAAAVGVCVVAIVAGLVSLITTSE